MSALTEHEILSCLKDNLGKAIQHCEDLAVLSRRGPTYDALRKELKLIEGCCRQIAFWRGGDARWLPIGMMMEEAHKRAGDWCRDRSLIATLDANPANPLFKKLADNLRKLERLTRDLENKRTGRKGPILPQPLEAPLRQGRPVQVVRPSGLIVPA